MIVQISYWHFGFPFADVDCDAFLNPVTPGPGRAVCCVTVSGQAGPWSPAPHRTLSLASDAASSGHPRSRRLTQDTYRVFSAEIRLDTDIIAVIKGTLGTQRCDFLTIY